MQMFFYFGGSGNSCLLSLAWNSQPEIGNKTLFSNPTIMCCFTTRFYPSDLTRVYNVLFASFQKHHQAKDYTTPMSTPSSLRICSITTMYNHIWSSWEREAIPPAAKPISWTELFSEDHIWYLGLGPVLLLVVHLEYWQMYLVFPVIKLQKKKNLYMIIKPISRFFKHLGLERSNIIYQ